MGASDEGTIGVDGVIEWRDTEGALHRDGGPARVFPGGRQEWFRHGRLHRDDGPAATYPDGRKVWFLEGSRCAKSDSGRQPSV